MKTKRIYKRSMAEYLVWAVNQQFELAYYKNKRKHGMQRRIAFID